MLQVEILNWYFAFEKVHRFHCYLMNIFNYTVIFHIENWVSFNSHGLSLMLVELVSCNPALLILGGRVSLHANLVVKNFLSYSFILNRPIIHYFYHPIWAIEYFYNWYPCTLLNLNPHPLPEYIFAIYKKKSRKLFDFGHPLLFQTLISLSAYLILYFDSFDTLM